MRTWGLIFSVAPGDFTVGLPLLAMGVTLLHFMHTIRTPRQPQDLNFETEAGFLRKNQIAGKRPNCSVLVWGLCVSACVYLKGRKCLSLERKCPFHRQQR